MPSEKVYNWGIIGPGRIAHNFAEGLAVLPEAKLYAVASRSEQRARDFAEKYQVPFYYEGYDQILTNPDVDIIYVATPHTSHFADTIMCLEKGMPVLCEKPFTIHSNQLKKLVHTARSKKVFLMEAIWTRFLPTIEKVIEIRESGEFGKIKAVYADFGFYAPFDPESRLYNLDLGGGALLDIGIYPVFLSLLLLGKPVEIKAIADLSQTGSDESCSILCKYPVGQMANLACTLAADTPIEANIIFEKGRVKINRRWFMPSSLAITDSKDKTTELNFKYEGNGYHLEAREAMDCLSKNLTESRKLPLQFSLDLMELLDEIRNQCHIHYPGVDP